MFIKFKVFIYCSILVLVTLFTVRNNVIEASKGSRNDKTCSSTKSISLNTTYDKDNQYFYDDSKKSKNIQRLRTILGDYISKGNKKGKEVNDGLKLMFSNNEESMSFKKQNVEIFATVIDEENVPVVPTLRRTQSSSSSSQFNAEKSASSQNTTVSDEWKADTMMDLNETETHTFQDKNAVESDTNTGQFNVTVDQAVKVPLSPDAIKVTNDSNAISDREDIPSFREWTEKHLAEEEKERGDDNNTNVPVNGKRPKVRNKNYASLDCGAKLIATNPEAKGAGSLLSTNRDEYLLSPCNSKIWFVVELCEAVQLKKVELANFELFSSSPKDFSVLISDRFPSREWTTVGQFLAKDVKSIQSFNLQPHHFTKYIKVEFHSHYGKEHFCPLSIFKVYGTSEFEVLETQDEELEHDGIENDDDVTEPIISDQDQKTKKKESNNLFGSARDVVMNIVKKAAEALVITPSQSGNSIQNDTNVNQTHTKLTSVRDCITPRYSVLCKQCSEAFFNKVYHLLSCYMKELHEMLQINAVWKPLLKYHVCFSFGIAPIYIKSYFTNISRTADFYTLRLLQKDMLAALCNLIAISENTLKPNITSSEHLLPNQTGDKALLLDPVCPSVIPTTSEIVSLSSSALSSSFKIVEHSMSSDDWYDEQKISSQIKPTKALVSDSEIPFLFKDPALATAIPNIAVIPELPKETETKARENEADSESAKEVDRTSVELVEDSNSLDSLISELEKSEASQQGSSASPQTSNPKPHPQKESVFVRLANRIKALERNMSLSGEYLEALSKRYKKQIEEAAEDRQKSLEREAKRSQEINHLTQHILELTVAVDSLIAERDSWSYKFIMVGEHSLIIFLELAIFIAIVCLCRGIPNVEISRRKFSLEWRRNRPSQDDTSAASTAVKRRQSLDDLNVTKPTKTHKRRPSEEALKMDGSTHQDLLIYETNRSSRSENRRKRRKRKELLLKSNANAINLETGDNIMNRKPVVNKFSNVPLSRSASASEIDEHSWGRIDYTRGTSVDTKNTDFRQDENKYPPPIFKTATSVRNKRLSGQINGVSSLSPVYDVSSDQDSSLPSTPVKEKKVNGIKKMVKRFF